jgi:hypothetical protein
MIPWWEVDEFTSKWYAAGRKYYYLPHSYNKCPNSFCTDFLKKIIIDVYFKNVILIALAQIKKYTKGFFFWFLPGYPHTLLKSETSLVQCS